MRNSSDSIFFIQKVKDYSKRDSNCIKAHELVGLFSISLGDYEEGIIHFKKALKHDSSSLISLYGLADYYNLRGENKKAYYFIQSALDVKREKYGDAFINMNFSKNIDVSLEELVFLRSVILMESGKFRLVIKDLKTLLESKYEHGMVNLYLSEVYYKIGNYDSSKYFYLNAKSEGIQDLKFDSIFNLKSY